MCTSSVQICYFLKGFTLNAYLNFERKELKLFLFKFCTFLLCITAQKFKNKLKNTSVNYNL